MARTTLGLLKPFALGRGYLDSIRFATFAGNASLAITVPGGEVWRLVSLFGFYTADATVANRFTLVRLRNADSQTQWMVSHNAALTAGNTLNLTYAPGLITAGSAAAGVAGVAVPDCFALPGWSYFISHSGGVAGDTFANVQLLVERFSIGSEGYETGADFNAVDRDVAEIFD